MSLSSVPGRSAHRLGTLATAVALAAAGVALTAPTADAATSCSANVFTRTFYANTAFSGAPKKTDCDSTIDQNWGTGAPAAGLPANSFGVRWSVTRDFGSGGPFTLAASGYDGIRVYLDGTRKISLWTNTSSSHSKTVNLTVPSGKHTLRVDYVNWTGTAKVKFGYAPRTSATYDKTAPLAPKGLRASYDNDTRRTSLSWSKNVEMDLANYRVYRKLSTATAWDYLATTTSTTYTDTPPTTGAVYQYRIRAIDKAANRSSATSALAVTTLDTTAPAAPTNLAVSTATPGGLSLTWTAVADAALYQMERAESADGPYRALDVSDDATFWDVPGDLGTVYYYRVVAVDKAGNESAPSASVHARFEDLTPPSPVTGLTATPTAYGFALSWQASTSDDVARYAVHRGVLHDSDEDGTGDVCVGNLVDYVSPDTTSYAYKTLPDGEQACLYVDVVDTYGNSTLQWTKKAQVVTATELDTTPGVATPAGSTLAFQTHVEDDGTVTLQWQGRNSGTYRVYRWSPGTGAYEKLSDVVGIRYTDATAGRGTTSYYWVTSVAADGTESAPSASYAITGP
ncbi:fibronectin type III domain-containing protein [Streptomyces longispororuber]|uniref:fibronectin type III domain-containing protein n=1 Tax=Streptomyces longispororuber TaxID=68230 RepID=UPI00210DEDBF|nr:PA14 domain-containing protein [Streptomyces longispororuber]MCQ4212027.1 PA14 domain-containing protein [Streptomyces longispororuber]